MNDRLKQNILPFVLSIFLPGLGQLLQGRIKPAACFFFGCIIAGITVIGLIIVPVIYFWNLFDAATDIT